MSALALAAVVEAATGLLLLASPGLVGQLLLGSAPAAPGAALARFGGIALLFLALACWPRRDAGRAGRAAGRAIWLFQPAAAACLVWVALGLGLRGPLLWPAVAYHAAATAVLGWVVLRQAQA